MSNIDLAVLAATALLFVFGVRALLSKDGHKQFGFGYGFVAALLLAWLFRDQVGGYGSGLRLGAGLFLTLPAFRAIQNPAGKSIVFSTLCLVIGVLLAAGPARMVYESFAPGAVPAAKRGLEARLEESRQGLADLQGFREVYTMKRGQLENELRARGTAEAILATAEGRSQAQQLKKVTVLLAELDEKEELLRTAIGALELELEQLRVAGENARMSIEDPRLRRALMEIEASSESTEIGSLEDLMERAELDAFLESELDLRK